jgi:hypothetical protein
MTYKRITVELLVVADESEAVVADLHTLLDQLEEKWTIFGGDIEATSVRHRGAKKRSALRQTIAAGETVTDAVRTARDRVAMALRAVV